MNLDIEDIDINATIDNLFRKVKRNVFHFSHQFKQLADDDRSEKFFRYKATINNASSNVILQNNDVTIDLIFNICGTSITWLTVKTSTIPNSGKGCFLRFDGNKDQLITCFMGYKVSPGKASIYAFKNIDLCKKTREDPLFWCFAHFIQHATGGALNLAKCFWILLSWRWVDGKAYLKTRSEAPLQLLLTSGYNPQPEEIPRIESSTPYRTLGVHITATGSMSKALSLHRQTSEKFAALLSTSHLSRSEAFFAFVLYFYPKITYSLPVSTFSNKECRWIQAPAMSAFLPKISLNRHTARSIVNGPSSLGGLQLPDVYADQSIGQIRLLLGHLRRGDSTSRLISIAISIMQLRIGSGILFLNLPFPKYEGWVEKTWLTSIWKFLHVSNLRVQVPTNIRLPSKQRDHDSFIMSEFIYYGFKKGELELINQCRLFHQVITVSDIAQADGISIDPAYMGRNKYLDRVSPLQWPAQGIPSSKAWTLWKRALLYLQNKGKLKQPLGEWLTRPHQQWNWLLRKEDKVLFHKLPSGWERYDSLVRHVGRITRSNEKPWYSKETGRICRSPRGQLAVATLIPSEVGDLFTVTSSTVLLPTREEIYEPEVDDADTGESLESSLGHNYIDKFLSLVQKTGYFRRLIGPLELPREMDLLDIANHISDHSLLVCSDGSFSQRSGTGSHAWVFSTTEGDILLQGAGPIDCIPELLSSYRPELGGITSNLFLLTVIVRLFDLKDGGVTLFCDNKSALENVFDSVPKRGIYPLLAVDYDLLVLAKDLVQSLPITVRPEWVKGHYSGDNRQVQHDLNALVDTMADKFRKNPPRGYAPSTAPMYHPRHGAVLIRGGSMITSKMKQVVYEQLFQEPLVATICKRFRWTAADFQKVDWDIFNKTFRTYSKTKQLGLAKLVHGLWNTGEQQVKFKQDTLGLCPGCKEKLETTAHVFQCAAIATVDFREREVLLLREFLEEQELPKQLKQNLFHGLAEWTRGEIDAPKYMAPTRGKVAAVDQIATQAYMEQTQLGWEALLRGHLSVSWRKIYRQAHPSEDGQKEDTLFRRLIRKLQQFSLAMWKHRNEILHGATREAAGTLAMTLVKSKVEEVFRQYESGELTLLQRDNYLFTKRTKEERMQGDVDTMMCWLRIVEVAMSAKERNKEHHKQQAARFFQPFRELGRKNKELRDLSFLRAKVVEAYAKFEDGAIQILEKDKYLFTAQTEEKLLSGEADSLVPWLRRLELAITFGSREHKLDQGTKKLFRPFFALGRQRLILSSVNAQEATEAVDTSPLLTEQQHVLQEHRAWQDTKEQDQVNCELSQQSRQQYQLRKQKVTPIDGLSSTVFSSSVEGEIEDALLPFLQLAQDSDSGTGPRSQTTESTLTDIREDRGIAFSQWYEGIKPPEHQVPSSASTSDLSVGTRAPRSSLLATQVRQGLEVLTSSPSTSSSETSSYDDGLGHYAVRNLPFQPPLEAVQISGGCTDIEGDSLPTLAPGLSPMASLAGGMSMDGSRDIDSVGSQPGWGMGGTVGFTLGSGTSEAAGLPLDEEANDPHALRAAGTLQGSAMSVAEYIAMLDSLRGTFDAYMRHANI